jgi:hypothetical protein
MNCIDQLVLINKIKLTFIQAGSAHQSELLSSFFIGSLVIIFITGFSVCGKSVFHITPEL